MNSKTENVTIMDCNTIANDIMQEINDIDIMERMLCTELSSEDLFRIDCGILYFLRNNIDFSSELLNQLEKNSFEKMSAKPVAKSIEEKIAEIQCETMIDITQPLENMFDEIINFIPAELKI